MGSLQASTAAGGRSQNRVSRLFSKMLVRKGISEVCMISVTISFVSALGGYEQGFAACLISEGATAFWAAVGLYGV